MSLNHAFQSSQVPNHEKDPVYNFRYSQILQKIDRVISLA